MVSFISNSPVDKSDQIALITTYQESLSLEIYARGFIELARLALEEALKGRTAIDAITPSIMYAIRHSAELFLKYVILELQEKHRMERVKLEQNEGHSLIAIFEKNKANIDLALECESQSAWNYREWLKEFEDILQQIYKVDPNGQEIRYPMNMKGTPNLGGKMQVSLRQMSIFAEHVDECFLKFIQRGC